MMMDCVKEICAIGFLGINSWIDIRKRQVSLPLIVMFAVWGIIWTIYSKTDFFDFLICVGTGIIFVGTSILTEAFWWYVKRNLK